MKNAINSSYANPSSYYDFNRFRNANKFISNPYLELVADTKFVRANWLFEDRSITVTFAGYNLVEYVVISDSLCGTVFGTTDLTNLRKIVNRFLNIEYIEL